MFDDPLGWSWLLHATALTATGAAVWAAGRRLQVALSAPARDARRRRAQLQQLSQATGLGVDAQQERLVGRFSGWTTEVHRSRLPMQEGDLPSEVWRVAFVVDAPAAVAHRALPRAPEGLQGARVEGELLVAHLPASGAEAVLPRQLEWMASVATGLHPAAVAPQHSRPTGVEATCARLGLQADGALPRWEGSWRQRHLMVEALSHTPLVEVHLALKVQLPGHLWVGGRHPRGAASRGGAPVPLPLVPDSGQLLASALPDQVEHCRELMADTALIAVLARHLGDSRGSRMYAGEAIVVRPATVWMVAPDRVLEAALAVAEAMEVAVEAPWRAICDHLPLQASDQRQGGLPVLVGRVDGFSLRVARDATGEGVHIEASAPAGLLVDGLQIRLRQPDEDAGVPTGNPILGKHVRITLPHDPAVSTVDLSALPTDALLPLLLGGPITHIDSGGARVTLPGLPVASDVIDAVNDLLRVLAALPRRA